MQNIAVYCGSGAGKNPAFAQGAKRLGEAIVEQRYGLVYGGGDVGLMGIIADEVLAREGNVIGVIPQALYEREVGHSKLTEMFVVDTMHERKALMMKHADAFIAMPGGIGTLEELFEVMTWYQLGFHYKPVGILNINGYYDQLLGFLEHSAEEAFIREDLNDLYVSDSNPIRLLEKLKAASEHTTGRIKRVD